MKNKTTTRISANALVTARRAVQTAAREAASAAGVPANIKWEELEAKCPELAEAVRWAGREIASWSDAEFGDSAPDVWVAEEFGASRETVDSIVEAYVDLVA